MTGGSGRYHTEKYFKNLYPQAGPEDQGCKYGL